MGDHVLVKWTTENKWDVYPLRNIGSQGVICKLLDDPRSVKALTTKEVEGLWDEEEYAPAYILAIGSQAAMERRRSKLVADLVVRSCPTGEKRGLEEELVSVTEDLEISRAKVHELAEKLDRALAKVSRLKEKYTDAKQLLDLYKMARNLKGTADQLTEAMSITSSAPGPCLPARLMVLTALYPLVHAALAPAWAKHGLQ